MMNNIWTHIFQNELAQKNDLVTPPGSRSSNNASTSHYQQVDWGTGESMLVGLFLMGHAMGTHKLFICSGYKP